MDYGKLLTRAFEITFKYRALWLFGFLMVLSGGSNSAGFDYSGSGGGSGRDAGFFTTPTMPPDH